MWYMISGRILFPLAAFSIYLSCPIANASSTANTTANATATVITSIGISKTQDLAFGSAAPSDTSKTINPATNTTSSAAFTVTGQASTAYDITLPADGVVTMVTGAGNTADTQITVGTFTSSPSTSGTLSGGGTQTVYVGATRAAIRASQATGAYTASFTVTVTYQ